MLNIKRIKKRKIDSLLNFTWWLLLFLSTKLLPCRMILELNSRWTKESWIEHFDKSLRTPFFSYDVLCTVGVDLSRFTCICFRDFLQDQQCIQCGLVQILLFFQFLCHGRPQFLAWEGIDFVDSLFYSLGYFWVATC